MHRTGRRRPQAHDRAQRGGLAGAVAAQQHRHLPARHREVDAVQDVIGADVRVHRLQRQHARSCRLLFRRHAQVGLLHHRRGDHRGRLAVGDQLAVVQHDDAVGQLAAPRPSCARPAGSVLSRRDFSSRIRSRITGTSSTLMPAVGSSNMKTFGSSAISSATSSLRWSPCGRLAARAPGACPARRTDSRICSASSIHARAIEPDAEQVEAEPAPRRLARLHRQAHVLLHAQVREQLRQLEGAAEAAVGARRCRQARDVLAVQQHLPGARAAAARR